MLSELYHIAKNLSHQGQQKRLVHADFGEPGLSTRSNLYLLLGGDGEIVKLEVLQTSETISLWTLKKGNFKFFPAARMPKPLIALPANDPRWNEIKTLTPQTLRALLSAQIHAVQPIDVHHERKQAERISDWRHVDQATIGNLHAFAAHFLHLTMDAKTFGTKLSVALDYALQHNRDGKVLKPLQALLCGTLKESKNKPPEVEFNVQIIFDYLPKSEIAGVLYSSKMKQVVLECLNSEQTVAPKKGGKAMAIQAERNCAFEGVRLVLLDGPYPDWSAQPVISKAFKPFSKFSDAPCNYRYHVADSNGFPIGAEIAKELVAAGCTITSPELRNKTWRSLRNGKFDIRNGKKTEARDVLSA